MRVQKTFKLFFDKYTSKVVIEAPLATLFRDRNLNNVKNTLDEYIKLLDGSPTGYIEFNNRWSRRRYYHSDIFQAYRIHDSLVHESDFSVRIEGKFIGVYSNDDDLIDHLANLDPSRTDTVSKTQNNDSKDFLLNNTNIIVVKKKTHEYKLKLGALGDNTSEFMDWAGKLSGVKIFNKLQVYRWGGGIMYVANDKTLTLCKLYLGKKIARIDRVVAADEI